MKMNNMFTKDFKSITSKDLQSVGGKGLSLGKMINEGFFVPNGFVVLSGVFDSFLEEVGINSKIKAILNTVDIKSVHTIENASVKIRAIIENAEIPNDITAAILKEFKDQSLDNVAVRSSATAEDGVDFAWAGQLESYLNVKEESLLKYIKNCWSSLFTPRAIFYRHENKLHNTHISVSVIVQKMVNSEKSGIAFSVHPVTEDRDQLIIEAGLGLGEAIVSGTVTPDSYVVSKSRDEIIEKTINAQHKAIYRSHNETDKGFNKWIELSNEDAEAQVLSEKQILELSEIIKKIETFYGFPVDIEWAFENKKFYVVQSRPITTLGA